MVQFKGENVTFPSDWLDKKALEEMKSGRELEGEGILIKVFFLGGGRGRRCTGHC